MGKGGGSIADFYIDNGIDPTDPDSFDAWLDGAEEGHNDGGWAYAGRCSTSGSAA